MSVIIYPSFSFFSAIHKQPNTLGLRPLSRPMLLGVCKGRSDARCLLSTSALQVQRYIYTTKRKGIKYTKYEERPLTTKVWARRHSW